MRERDREIMIMKEKQKTKLISYKKNKYDNEIE